MRTIPDERKMVTADFNRGFIYARHHRSLPPGAIADGQNMLVLDDELMGRECYERAYTNVLPSKRTANLKTFYLPTGYYIVLSINTDGSYSLYEGMSESQTLIQPSNFVSGYSTHGDARAFREAIWITTGCSRPYRLATAWALGATDRYQYAGCFAPLFSASDTAILTAVENGGPGGLAAGHYYYAMTLLYGTNGKWGESRPGAVGQVTVTSTYDGIARVVDTGAGLPAAATTYVPGSDPRYYGCWGRRLYRTKKDGDRNGPYYFIQQVNEMASTDFEDNIHDDELSGVIIAAKYLNDDEQLPPVCEFCELHDGRMVYADTTHVWWSNVSLSGEPLPDQVHSVNNVLNLPVGPNEWITGLASIRGVLMVPTNRRLFMVQVGLGAGSRLVEGSRGCVAKKSWAPGRNGAFYLSSEGPCFTDLGQSYPLGDVESSLRIKHYLEDYCNNLELCSGMYRNGYYYLSYPDRRDSPPPENACTRTLVWDDDRKCWMPPWNVPMNCAVGEDSRIIWVDGTHASNGYVMQFNSSIRSDYVVATATATAMTARARFGSFSGNESGDMAVMLRAYIRAKVPVDATVTVTGYYDDVAGTALTLAAGTMSNPKVQVYPFARQMGNAVELEFKSTTAGPRWALASLNVETGDTA